MSADKEMVALREAAQAFSDGLHAPVRDANDSGFAKLDRRLRAAAITLAGMAKAKRGYSREFPTTREKRVSFMLDKIPPALWIRVKAKAKREGVSLRALILGWLREWAVSSSEERE